MKRLTKTTLMIAGMYAVTLSGRPELILDYRIIALVIAGAIMLLTQPDFSADDAKKHKATDRYSMLFILLAGLFSYVIPVIEWAYFSKTAVPQSNVIWTAIGALMIVGGLAFRIWSIRTLGKFFTATVQVQSGQRVIQHGPYAIVRHPSYLGAFVAIIGGSVFLNAPIGVIASIVLMVFAYRSRLATEEATLIEEFGDEYREYSKRVARIIPFVHRIQSLQSENPEERVHNNVVRLDGCNNSIR